jgi:hypothetical protein
MPFQSKAQMRWAFATRQPFAKEWADMTDETKLPERVRPHTTSFFHPRHQAKVVNAGGASKPRS